MSGEEGPPLSFGDSQTIFPRSFLYATCDATVGLDVSHCILELLGVGVYFHGAKVNAILDQRECHGSKAFQLFFQSKHYLTLQLAQVNV